MSELRSKSLDTILDWWAQELGISGADLWATHQGITLSGNSLQPGIFAFRRGEFVRIAAAPWKLENIRDEILNKKLTTIFSKGFWKKYLPEMCGKVIGPALLYYADSPPEEWKSFKAPQGMMLRGLAAMDARAFAELASALSKKEYEHCGLEFGPHPMWGVFLNKQLLAVAGYDAWPGRIAHIGVAVHPDFRGQKLGRLVAMAAARGAMARKRIVQYRTHADNTGSVGIAKALGLELFAETIYVRPPEQPANNAPAT